MLILFSIRITTFNPSSVSDGLYQISSKLINGKAQSIQNMSQGFKDFISESHGAKLFPDLLYGIHFRGIRRNMQKFNIVRDLQPLGLVPASAVANEKNLVFGIGF